MFFLQTNGSGVLSFATPSSGTNTPSFSVYRNTSTQSFTTSTDTKSQFNGELYDTDSAFDSTTNYRFTVPTGKSGKYFFHANLADGNTGSNVWEVNFFKNGTKTNQHRNVSGILYGQVSVSAVIDLVATDYVEVFMNCGHGSPLLDYASRATYFMGFKLL